MSVLVFIENWDGKFKKLSFELVSYAHAVAKMLNAETIALSIGDVGDPELSSLGNYGASKVISVKEDRLNQLVNQAFASVIAQAAHKTGATVVVMANNNTGKAVAPRLSVKLKAGVGAGVFGLPVTTEPFAVHKKVFNGKAFATIGIKSPIRILTLAQNSFGVHQTGGAAAVELFSPELSGHDFKTSVKEVSKVTGKVLLTDAEIVVSGGRGMKGPENWGPIEELAGLLGAATACSRPVSDEGWRPHEEHTGQTGKIIAPNLYMGFGISGAIQHLAGVSSSKCIVAVNKDPDAPVFEAANYGIVGDAMKVLPELIAAVRELKAE
jgi:electron transfer flavoprotein alpha subunit